MKRILVLYYSRTGNTERMANNIAQGARISDNISVELSYHIEPQELGGYDVIVVGAPTYHHDMPIDFKNLFEEAAVQGINLKGKIGVAFGSYGWSGEAPKLVLEIMKNRFQMQVTEQPLLSNYAPNEKTIASCKELGKRIAENLLNSP